MEIIKSVFDLYNRKETGLSRTLAALIYSDYRIIKEILKKNGYKFTKEDSKTLEIYFEPSFGHSRFDILCVSKNYVIVIETKLGLNVVTDEQSNRYIEIISQYKQPNKILILLTQFDNQKVNKNNAIEIISEQWKSFYEIIKRLKITLNITEEFSNYITGSHLMKISDIDIWAVVISKDSEKEKIETSLIYRNDKYHQPIFIGLREWDSILKKVIIKKLYPVNEILSPDNPRARIYNQDGSNAFIYILGNPFTLEKPIIKKFSQNSAIGVSFSDIEP
jgi:hypothetical protein